VKERFAELWGLVAHLADLARIPGDCDEVGLRVAEGYGSGIAEKINVALERAVDAWSGALAEIQAIEGWEEVPELVEILEHLVDQGEALRPDEGDANEFRIEVGAVGAWASRLQQSLTMLEVIRLARLGTE
jgi:hypothetical protein